jgi:hypothetical protein
VLTDHRLPVALLTLRLETANALGDVNEVQFERRQRWLKMVLLLET